MLKVKLHWRVEDCREQLPKLQIKAVAGPRNQPKLLKINSKS
jgi:hypothetical protein